MNTFLIQFIFYLLVIIILGFFVFSILSKYKILKKADQKIREFNSKKFLSETEKTDAKLLLKTELNVMKGQIFSINNTITLMWKEELQDKINLL